MKNASLENSAGLAEQIEALKASLADERAAADRAIKKAVKMGGGWGFGIFAGVSYTGGGEVEPVVGVGLVWKVF